MVVAIGVASLVAPMMVHAQGGVIRGGVYSADTGLPLAGAQVELVGAGMRVAAGAGGVYRLEDLPPGRHALQVRAAFHLPERLEGITVEGGAEVELDVELRPDPLRLPQIEVVAEPAVTLRGLPGSASLVGVRELEATQPLSAAEALSRVAGVVVREDSGPFGMRQNIGIRGLNPDRSRKVLVLEDGIPVALAPYGEPEMYYSPPIERMERVEVVKGSGSIRFGPQTIGGVINYRTPAPPLARRGALELWGGEREFVNARGWYGGTAGRLGARGEVMHKRGDGVREVFFEATDVTGKLGVELTSRSRVGLKLNAYRETSASTYLGLTQAMWERDPWQNPVPHDRLEVARAAGSLTHQWLPVGGWSVQTTVYGHRIDRDWRRQDFDRADLGREYVGIAGDPDVPGGALFLRASTGHRNRSFDVGGIDSRVSGRTYMIALPVEVEVGVRAHYERAVELRLNGDAPDAMSGERVQDEVRTGRALAAFVQNRLEPVPGLVASAGLRLEHFDFERRIRRELVGGEPADVDTRADARLTELIPGIGLSYAPSEVLAVFAGAHRGFAPPRIKDAISSAGVSLRLEAERSWNLELGARAAPAPWLKAELTLFLLDFSNQVVPASESVGGTGTGLINAGATIHRGFEAMAGLDLGALAGRSTGVALDASYTFTRAEFAGGIYDGRPLPYAPEHVLAAGVSMTFAAGTGVHLRGLLQSSQLTDAEGTEQPTADGLAGRIPAYRVWDLTVRQPLAGGRMTAFLAVKNLLDARYIASRAPLGIQPGHPRQANLGLRYRLGI